MEKSTHFAHPGFLLALGCVLCSAEARAETIAPPAHPVDRIKACHCDGRTYLVFKKNPAAETRYLVYRNRVPFDRIGPLQPVAIVPRDSFAHPENGTPFVVPQGRLAADDGLFVYAPKEAGAAWYAVLPEGTTNTALVVGQNLTAEPVDEAVPEHPGAIFQMSESTDKSKEEDGKDYAPGEWVTDHYAFWMDPEAWEQAQGGVLKPGEKAGEYAGSFFSISYEKKRAGNGPLPVMIFLHSLGMGGNGAPHRRREEGFLTIFLIDHRRTWWEGRTEARINAEVDFLLNCGKYPIDPERIYLGGQSMGGHGTIVNALRHPERYAAAYARNPNIVSTLREQVRTDVELPPIITFFGFKDSKDFGPQGNAPFIQQMQASRQGIWSRWQDVGHSVPPAFDTPYTNALPGGLTRFKRHEAFPVFLNATSDDNAGQRGTENVVSNGTVNMRLDWASSLHPMGLKDEALVDEEGKFAMTFRAEADCATDLSFRRLQWFKPVVGSRLTFSNIESETGRELQKGPIQVASDGGFIISGVKMRKAGNRVTIMK